MVHLQKAIIVLSLACASGLTLQGHESQVADKDIKIFCYTWIGDRQKEFDAIPAMKEQLAGCDGHALLADPDIKRQDVEHVKDAPDHGIGRDMIHVLPMWGHLLKQDLDKYDWVVGVEWDHIVRPSLVRKTIAKDLDILKRGTPEEKKSVEEAMMLMWGNAFLFNRKLVQSMRQQWKVLGQTKVTSDADNGCPAWYSADGFGYKGSLLEKPIPKKLEFVPIERLWSLCPQDDGYPKMMQAMSPPVAHYGANGCNQIGHNGLGEDFPMHCYNMPTGGDGGATVVQAKRIRGIAEGKFSSFGAEERFAKNVNLDEVPILHKVYDPKTHELARQLLKY